MELIHRDDVPNEVLEALQAAHPGAKIICVGDIPTDQLPEEVKKALADLHRAWDVSIASGTCFDCGAQMPNYPDVEEMADDWKPAPKWCWLSQDDTPVAWICPECDKREMT